MSLSNILTSSLIVEGQRQGCYTPDTEFNAITGVCSIIGESYLEDSFAFYDRLIEWFKDYFESGKEKVTLNIKLEYFNTSSSRALLDMFIVLKNYQESGKRINVNWYYPNPDEDDLQAEAEDFMEESGLVMDLIEYPLED